MASDRAIDSATVLASVSYALSERDSEVGRLRRRSDKQYGDRRLLLWLHAEAVHERGQLRAERDELRAHGVYKDIGQADTRLRAQLDLLRWLHAEAIWKLEAAWRDLDGWEQLADDQAGEIVVQANEKLRAELAKANQRVAVHEQIRHHVEDVLDEAIGTEVGNGAGEGLVGDVALLARQRDEARAELDAVKAKAPMKWQWMTAPISEVQHLIPAERDGQRTSICGETRSVTWREPQEGDQFCASCAFGDDGQPNAEATVQASPTLAELSGLQCGKTGSTSIEGCDGTCSACKPDDAPATPTEPRAVYHDPGDLQYEYDEDDNPNNPSVGWNIAFGCRVTFGHDEGNWRVSVSVSDAERRNGGGVRSVTRQQIRAFAHHLIQLTEAVEDQPNAPKEPRVWRKGDEPPPFDVKQVRHDNSQVFTRVGPNGWRAGAGRVITGEQLIAGIGGYKLTEVIGDGAS